MKDEYKEFANFCLCCAFSYCAQIKEYFIMALTTMKLFLKYCIYKNMLKKILLIFMLNIYSSGYAKNIRNSFLGAYIAYIPVDELFPDNLSTEERDARRYMLSYESLSDVQFFDVMQTDISKIFMLYINFIMHADKIYYGEMVTDESLLSQENSKFEPRFDDSRFDDSDRATFSTSNMNIDAISDTSASENVLEKLERNLASDIAIKNGTIFTGHDQYTIAAMDEMWGNLSTKFDMATLKNVLKLVARGWKFDIKREAVLKAIWPKFYYDDYNKNLEYLLCVSESDFATALELYEDIVDITEYYKGDSYVLYTNLKNIKKIYEFYAYNLRAIFAIINSFFCLGGFQWHRISNFLTDDGLRGVGYYNNEMVIGNCCNVRSKVKITFYDGNITKTEKNELYYNWFAEFIVKKSNTFWKCNILQIFRDFEVDRFDCRYRNQPYPGTYERFSLDRSSGDYISQKNGCSIVTPTNKLVQLDLLKDDSVIKMTIY